MVKLVRWNPYREMMSYRNAMDRLVDSDFFNTMSIRTQPRNWGLALDVMENDEAYVVKASLPGFDPEDVDITFENEMLTIKAEVKEEQEEKDEERRYYMRERRYGRFSRSISLPSTIDVDAIEANFEAGVLTLSLPKAEEAKPKRIPVQTVKEA